MGNALHSATRCGKVEAVRLLNNGAATHVRGEDHGNAVQAAAAALSNLE